ncbi:MAG TPA: sodium:solute symporter [Pseudomonadota bacterium]|nr:sodium:solute symporter [Pseudomonadota bacterium]
MTQLDWLILIGTLAVIVSVGLWKGRSVRTAEQYLRAGRDMKWYTIGLSIMATQASAITFLSMPGQAYEDGLGFVQFYFGLPVAMVILSAAIVPIFSRLRVATAYEYLEHRFDRRTRMLTAFLFLLQRGLGTGISIYAPAIILSTVLGWPLHLTNLLIGVLVIVYTVSGGTRVVSQTQTYQMIVMLSGVLLAFLFILSALPKEVSLPDALYIAGSLGKLHAVDFSLRLDTRYTFWSGMTGGLFVALAYFGTDQTQVQRYLTGGSLVESRLGLLLNGIVKIPMQFVILLVGVLVLVFYQFQRPPLFFHATELHRAEQSVYSAELRSVEDSYSQVFSRKQKLIDDLLFARRSGNVEAMQSAKKSLQSADSEAKQLRQAAKGIVRKANPRAETKDADYIFITFVKDHFPSGLYGLFLAVIFCAAMSATASALNALGATTVVDFYKTSLRPHESDRHYFLAAKGFTILWGLLAMLFATFASLVDNLIQAVNILGSIFYGPTLGVFLVGFFLPRVGAKSVFVSLVAAQALVLLVFAFSSIGFLWYNVIGCGAVLILSILGMRFETAPKPTVTTS